MGGRAGGREARGREGARAPHSPSGAACTQLTPSPLRARSHLTEKMMKKADQNKDGAMDFEEFADWFTTTSKDIRLFRRASHKAGSLEGGAAPSKPVRPAPARHGARRPRPPPGSRRPPPDPSRLIAGRAGASQEATTESPPHPVRTPELWRTSKRLEASEQRVLELTQQVETLRALNADLRRQDRGGAEGAFAAEVAQATQGLRAELERTLGVLTRLETTASAQGSARRSQRTAKSSRVVPRQDTVSRSISSQQRDSRDV